MPILKTNRNISLNAIMIKSYMKSMDEEGRVNSRGKEKSFMIICFLPRSGESYKLNLFSVSSSILSVSLFTRYVREMVT